MRRVGGCSYTVLVENGKICPDICLVLSPRLMYARTFRAMEGRGRRIFNVPGGIRFRSYLGISEFGGGYFCWEIEIIGVFLFLLRTMKEGRKLVGVKCKIQRCADVEGFRGMGSF